MIHSNVHKARILDDIVDTVGDRFAIGEVFEVLYIYRDVLSFRLPFSPIILEVADEFLLLAVHGDHRMALLLKSLTALMDMLKLEISIRM